MNTKSANGFTLIELLMTLLVGAIVLTVAVPSFRSFIMSNRAATQTNELVAALALARSEAVRRGLPVSACASTDGATCAASTNWASGWIVFVDDTGTSGTLDGTDELVRIHEQLGGNSTLTGDDDFIRYDSQGYYNAGATSFDLEPTDCTGDMRRQVSISPSGGTVTEKVNC